MNTKTKFFQNGNVAFLKVRVQHCLLVMVEKWRQCLDNAEVNESLFTDLSKDFDCILHDLLIAELSVYGFD